MSEEIGRGLTRILSFLIATAVVLLGCAANSVGETSGLAAVSVAESAATAVPSPPPPTVMAPVAPTAVLTRQPLPTSTPPPPVFANPLDDDMAQTAVAYDAEFIHFTPENSGIWAYTANSFLHPIALEVWQETAFLLDGGRVLAINLTKPTPPRVLLASGDTVDGARVMEPLDLTVGEAGLYVLDRVGDVYRYELADGRWHLERYDRPVSDTSGHYYVALDTEADAQFLLEANYKIGIQTASDTPDLAWPLPDVRAVDISAQGEDVYVLAREIDTWAGRALRYQNTVSMIYFKPPKIISQPRQIAAGETAVYILDQAGKRLLACDRETGVLQTVYQLPQNDQISAFWIDETDQRLILAGRDRLFFYQEPERLTAVSASPLLIGAQSHDADFLAKPTGFVVPIGGSGVTRRDFQLPGAPRHYRLGIHNGIDFYWQPGTQTLAVADGVVIRAVLDYVSPTQAQFSAWRAETLQLGYTSEEALDVYRGRQVWLRHENGLVTRYVHLSGIAPEIVEGATVTQGQLVGTVGNSGSPLSLTSETADAHLHFEVWLNDYYVGQFLRPIEAREWVEMTFTGMTDGN